jgi:Cdc6-like AAA superfamily ATPase
MTTDSARLAISSSSSDLPTRKERYAALLISRSTPEELFSCLTSSPPRIRRVLAGVDSTISQCAEYFTLAALHSMSGTASPLLLTGSKGSGRTSIAKHVGDLLEGDRDILAGKPLICPRMRSWLVELTTQRLCTWT